MRLKMVLLIILALILLVSLVSADVDVYDFNTDQASLELLSRIDCEDLNPIPSDILPDSNCAATVDETADAGLDTPTDSDYVDIDIKFANENDEGYWRLNLSTGTTYDGKTIDNISVMVQHRYSTAGQQLLAYPYFYNYSDSDWYSVGYAGDDPSTVLSFDIYWIDQNADDFIDADGYINFILVGFNTDINDNSFWEWDYVNITVYSTSNLVNFTEIPRNTSVVYNEDFPYIDFNGTNVNTWNINDTLFNISQEGVLLNASKIGAGEYHLNISINDSNNIFNETIFNLTVTKGDPSMSTNVVGPTTYETTFTAIEGTCGTELAGFCNVTINATGYNNSIDIILSAGHHNISVNTSGNQNWTDDYFGTNRIISQLTSSVNLLLNDTDGIYEQVEGFVNITAYNLTRAEGNITLYQNGTILNSSLNLIEHTKTFTPGYYNITIFNNETQNTTSSVEEHTLVISGVADETKPQWTTIPNNVSDPWNTRPLLVQFVATDDSGSVVYSINDTSRFTINSSGHLINDSVLDLDEYIINVSVRDPSNNFNHSLFLYNVTENQVGDVTILPSSVTYSQIQKLVNESFIITYQIDSNATNIFTASMLNQITPTKYFNYTFNETEFLVYKDITRYITANITLNATIPIGTYFGNSSIVRNADSTTWQTEIEITVDPPAGKPVLYDVLEAKCSLFNGDVCDTDTTGGTIFSTTKSLVLNNTGDYNLSNCNMILYGTLPPGSLTVNDTDFNVENTTSIDISYTITNPAVGGYFSWLDIQCNATATGLPASLLSDNIPTIDLTISVSGDEGSSSGAGPQATTDINATDILQQGDICGNLVCSDTESPVSCPQDCPIGKIFCPINDLGSCPNWVFSWLIYGIIATVMVVIYKNQTKRKIK